RKSRPGMAVLGRGAHQNSDLVKRSICVERPMPYWIREFENTQSGKRFRVYSESEWIPPLRRDIANLQNNPDWTDDAIYKHDPSLDIKKEGNCTLTVDPL